MGILDNINISARLNLNSLLGLQASDPSYSPFNIDKFRSNLSAHRELAMAQRMGVGIYVPELVRQASGGDGSHALYLQCESQELPSRDITMIEYRHYGFIKRLPHHNQYGAASFNFICTGDMWEKKLFDRWMDIMIPTNSGLVSYPIDSQGKHQYECQINITQYDSTGKGAYTVGLIDAVPVSVGALSGSWNSDNHHTLPVTFNFRKWISDYTKANIAPTDFGQASGAPQTIPNSTSSINNQTNNNTGQTVTPFDSGTTTQFE